MSIIAGVDSSTQSTKVVLRDANNGRILGSGRAPHQPVFPPFSEQDPESWWQAFLQAFKGAIDAADASPRDIVALSVAAQCHGLVALDSAQKVIRPAKLWNDTTSAPEMAELLATVGSDQFAARTGSIPTAAFTISKLLWLKRNEPENFARTRSVLLPHDWLTWRLTGRFVTDRSEASGTGYFNAEAMRYDEFLLAAIDGDRDWTGMFPEVLAPAETAGTVLRDVAEMLGLSNDVVVGPGAGDQHASALGIGAEVGDVVYSLGTSGVVFGVAQDRHVDADGNVNCVADANGGYLPLVCTLNAARVADTFATLLGVDHAALSELALTAPLSSDRPVLAAFLDGERTPNRPNATGTLTGITTSTSRAEVALAAFEGVVLGLTSGQAALERIGVVTTGRILAVGGGADSPAFQQVLSDATGRPVLLPDVREAVASGAAVQAAACRFGATIDDIRTAWAPTTTVAAEPRVTHPDPVIAARYASVASWTDGDKHVR
jgi:xylulokinase